MNRSEDIKSRPSLLSFLSCYFSQMTLPSLESDYPSRELLNESTTLLGQGHDVRSRHSVDQNFDEIPNFINERRNALQEELRTIKGKTAYHLAMLQAPGFVTGLDIFFLRVEDWNQALASTRMLNYFEAKLSLFGSHALGRQLQATDLDCGAMKCLRSGVFQILPSRDKQTRRILCFFPCNYTDGQMTDLVKAWWYFVMKIVENGNPKFQRSDFVGVVFHDSSHGVMQLDYHLYWHALCSLRQLPLKVSEWHFCYDDFVIDSALPVLSYCYTRQGRTDSLHLHKGSRTECAYSLMKAGLPTHELPLTEVGSVEIKHHQKWLNEYCGIGNLDHRK